MAIFLVASKSLLAYPYNVFVLAYNAFSVEYSITVNIFENISTFNWNLIGYLKTSQSSSTVCNENLRKRNLLQICN